jgi:hypothetical protein
MEHDLAIISKSRAIPGWKENRISPAEKGTIFSGLTNVSGQNVPAWSPAD